MLERQRRSGARACPLGERGFTVVQLVITIAIISVVSTFAVMGIARARSSMRLSASERELAAYLEQARADSIRRHAEVPDDAGDPDTRATITLPAAGGTTYTVRMDFDKDGTIDDARTIPLQSGVSFSTDANMIVFDWRGRTVDAVEIGLVNDRGDTSTIVITGAGDITLNSEAFRDG
ncbi:MAG TPA: GspH/FimT family pseudopilin, partial [Pyrinomonadaceae bacterium]|nr:GspH/FimT family pseudopilin [Pyrinomonadaceae bacterium]